MSSEEEFKDILNDKLAERNFSFDATSWEQAREMIDSTRDKEKRRPFFWIILGAALLLGGISVIYLLNSNKVDEKISENKIQEPATKKVFVQDNKTSNEKINNKPKKDQKPIQSVGKNVVATEQGKNDLTSQPSNDSEKNQLIATGKPIPTKNKIKSLEDLQKIPGQGYQVFISIRKIENSDIVKKDEPLSVGKDLQSDISINKSVKPAEQKPDSNLQKAPELVMSPKDSVTKENKNPETVAVKDSTKSNPSAENNPLASESKRPKDPRHFVSAEGGIMYLYGWQNPGGRDASGYNPFASINYSKVISDKITLGAGIGYYSVGHLSYSSKTSAVTKYALGEESDLTVITPTRLHYIAFPFRATWAFDRNNIFGASYNFGYLLTTDVSTKTFSSKYNQSTDPVTKKDHGYTQGFNPYDHQLGLFYRRRIWEDLFVNTELMFGLSDIKQNGFFGSNSFERNMGIRCTLYYQFIKIR